MNQTQQTLEHSDFCGQPHAPYFTSSCEPECDYYREAVRECIDSGEHFRQTVSDGGYDVCFNCGAKA